MRNVHVKAEEMEQVGQGGKIVLHPGDGSRWSLWKRRNVVKLRRLPENVIIEEGQTPGEGEADADPSVGL
jgi:hypothetical protein